MAVATKDARPREGTLAPRSDRFLQLALLLAPIVFLLVMAWRNRWIEEDAFLNFRVVDQIRAGHGPVFNVGERVEIFTSTLWLAMLTVARSVLPFVKIEYLSIAGGLLLTGLGLWWAERGAAVLWRSDSARRRPPTDSDSQSPTAVLVPFGVVVVAALPASWDWATSGLENGLSLAWLGALMLVVATVTRPGALPMSVPACARRRRAPRPRPARAPRPRRRECRRDRRRALVASSSRCGARAGSSSASARSRSATRSSVPGTTARSFRTPRSPRTRAACTGRRAGTTSSTSSCRTGSGCPLLAIVVAGVLTVRAKAPRPALVPMLALPVGGLLHALFIVESGGDYLHARLLLPSLFAIVAPFAVIPWRPQFRLPLVAVGIWALVAIAFLRPSLHQQLVPLTHYDVADGRALMSDLTKPGHRPLLATDFAFDDGVRAKRLRGTRCPRARHHVRRRPPRRHARAHHLVDRRERDQRLPRRSGGSGAGGQQLG